MKKYKILDTESTRDFATGLIGIVFTGDKDGKYIKLNTVCGELAFDTDEVEEVL